MGFDSAITERSDEHLLLVGGDAAARARRASALDGASSEVLTTECGNDALKAMLRCPVSLVILDASLTGLDCIELITLMRGHQRTASIPVLVIADEDHDARFALRAYEAGAVDVLSNPVHDELLQAKVRVFLDIARRQNQLAEARDRADAANRAKTRFITNVSHEIRTPMTAIVGYADLLQADRGEIDLADAATTIKRNAIHLLSILNDILDLSKMEADRLEVGRSWCSPVAILREVAELLAVQADQKGLQFDVRFLSQMPRSIETDPLRLRQILINIVGNAIKFTSSGEVEMRAHIEGQSDGHLLIEVRDTGPGIPASKLDRVFAPFVQLNAADRRSEPGSGIGLTIARRLLTMLGGQLIAESEFGRGSCFTIRLPIGPIDALQLISADEVPTDSPHTMPLADQRAAARRVLLAEDGIDNQRLIRLLTERLGASITIVDNGQRAVEEALHRLGTDCPYDLILMDMQMPVLDGYEATRRLRKAGYRGRIVAVTAHAMTDDLGKCLDAGCDDYLTKPIDPQLLARVVCDVSSRVSAAST